MTAKRLFSKTMPFVWAKLLLGGATVLISVVLLTIMMGLGWLFGDAAMLIMFILWISATGFVRFIIMHYFGYLVKTGHIAVIAEACFTGLMDIHKLCHISSGGQLESRFPGWMITNTIHLGLVSLSRKLSASNAPSWGKTAYIGTTYSRLNRKCTGYRRGCLHHRVIEKWTY